MTDSSPDSTPTSRAELEARVIEVLAEVLALEPSEIRLDASIREDFNASSLDLVQLLWSLEEAVGDSIPDEEIERFQTPEDIVTYLATRLGVA